MVSETQDRLLWVVVEHSDVGDTVVGVFSTLEAARRAIDGVSPERLEDYRIEGHALDEGKRQPTPWRVLLREDGTVEDASPFVGCSSCDDADNYERMRRLSYVDESGELSLVVFARTPGSAMEAAARFKTWLVEQGLWRDELPLEPIEAPS